MQPVIVMWDWVIYVDKIVCTYGTGEKRIVLVGNYLGGNFHKPRPPYLASPYHGESRRGTMLSAAVAGDVYGISIGG